MTNEEKILEMLTAMQMDIIGMKGDITGMKGDITGMKGDITGLKGDILKLQLQNENVIIPQLKLLAEGHQMLAETLAPKNKVDELESDVNLLKLAVQTMSAEIQQLKKAQ